MYYWKDDSDVYHTNPPGVCSKNHYDEDDPEWNKGKKPPSGHWDYCDECQSLDEE